MSLRATLSEDIKTAMKAQDKERLQVLRMLLSELKYAQVAAGNLQTELAFAEEQRVIASYFKKLEKSLAEYPDGDQRLKIKGEMEIVEAYLPKRASEAEVRSAVEQLLSSTAERQFGPLMKELMNRFGNSADGKLLSSVLKDALSR